MSEQEFIVNTVLTFIVFAAFIYIVLAWLIPRDVALRHFRAACMAVCFTLIVAGFVILGVGISSESDTLPHGFALFTTFLLLVENGVLGLVVLGWITDRFDSKEDDKGHKAQSGSSTTVYYHGEEYLLPRDREALDRLVAIEDRHEDARLNVLADAAQMVASWQDR